MPEFAYEAVAATGQRSQGTLAAGTEREALALLDSQGLMPVRITQTKAAGGVHRGGRRVRGRYMATFYSQLADLLHSGVPLLRSLDILDRQNSQPVLAETLRDVRNK